MTLILIGLLYRFLLSLRYSVTFINKELLNTGRPTLFLANHLALVDPQILVAHFYKYSPVAPVITEKYTHIPGLRWFFRRLHAIPVPDLENGVRDASVMNKLKERVLSLLNTGNNVLLYPSGRLSDTGAESIGNKRSAYEIVCCIPPNIAIVGVRISGLWGSRFSKAITGKTPSLGKAFFGSFLFAFRHFFFFMPHRKVTIRLEDITEEAKQRCNTSRHDFNHWLEQFFNENPPD